MGSSATSIRSCSTPATSASRGGSKRRWSGVSRKRWSCASTCGPSKRSCCGAPTSRPRPCTSSSAPAADAGRPDYVCLFATSIGPGVRALAEQWKDEGQYLRSHILQVLALEGAEGFAELLHQRIREMWGFADPPDTTMKDLFKARYRAVRVSF